MRHGTSTVRVSASGVLYEPRTVAPQVVMRLTRCNGAFCTEYVVDGQVFRTVVDTGSPFLMVDGRCGALTAPTPYCFAAPVRSVDLQDMSEEGYGSSAIAASPPLYVSPSWSAIAASPFVLEPPEGHIVERAGRRGPLHLPAVIQVYTLDCFYSTRCGY